MGLRRTVAVVTLGSAVGLVVAPLAVPAAVGMLGFGAGGIVAGSWAAGFMSSYGGAVAANSACAILQSVGAAGLATPTIVATEGVAATLAAISGYFFKGKRAAADKDSMHEYQAVEAAPKCPPEQDGDDGVEQIGFPSAADEDSVHEDQVLEEAAPTCPLEQDGDHTFSSALEGSRVLPLS